MITFIRRSCLLFWWPGGSHPSPNSSRNQSRPPRAVFDPPRGRTGFPVRGQPDILTDRTLGRPDEPGALNRLRVQTAGLVDESHPDRGSEQPDEHVAVHERAEIATVGLIATEGVGWEYRPKSGLVLLGRLGCRHPTTVLCERRSRIHSRAQIVTSRSFRCLRDDDLRPRIRVRMRRAAQCSGPTGTS